MQNREFTKTSATREVLRVAVGGVSQQILPIIPDLTKGKCRFSTVKGNIAEEMFASDISK